MRARSLLPLAAAAAMLGGGFPTRDEALALAFGKDAVVTSAVHWLTEEQRQRAEILAGAPVRAMAEIWTARDAQGRLLGAGLVDARTVRTHGQRLLFAIAPDRSLRRVTVLGFDEPRDYLPKSAWYDALAGKRLDAQLELKKGVHAVTGATLTARATVAGAREALALHAVLAGGDE